MKYLFIVNPVAGKGHGTRILAELKDVLAQEHLKHDIVLTRAKGEAVDLARRSDADAVVAVGGDGTVNEVANGILDSGKRLGIIPSGSGNDLIKSLGIPRNPREAFKVLKDGLYRPIDIGVVTWDCQDGKGKAIPEKERRYFVNGVGIGFDAAVARRANNISYLSGTLLYLVAVLLTLGEYRAPTFEIVSGDAYRSSARQLLIAVGNGACAGGGFYLTPRAKLNDGLLDVCVIDSLSLFGVLKLVPRVLRASHLGTKGISYLQGRNFSVSASEPFAVHADGEVLVAEAMAVDIGIHKTSLSIIAPA